VVGTRQWVIAADTAKQWLDGQPKWVDLLYISDIPIRRHCKIRAAANSFDSLWEPYFEERIGVKMQGNLQGRRKLVRLWLAQNSQSPHCQERINLTGGSTHPRQQGWSKKLSHSVADRIEWRGMQSPSS
jgi:RNA-directed DNA polymerase